MHWIPKNPTPTQLRKLYEEGLPGWQYHEATMDALMADGKSNLFADAAPHLAGIGKGQKSLLWRSREKYDPGAFGEEPQTVGSCVAHGARNNCDTTRSVEIDINNEPEIYYKRGAIEPTYKARGHYGEGMDPAAATRFHVDYGFLFREKYPFGDLSKLNESLCYSRGWSAAQWELVKEACKAHNVGKWIAPSTTDEAKDLMYAGYAGHSGQNYGVQTSSDSRGISVTGRSWNHDMATVGYDDTKEVYPESVFLIANSWANWNSKPKVWPGDRYGPWPVGSFWVPEDIYARYFVGSRSIFFYCDIKGVPQKNLPDWGAPGWL